MPTLSDYMRIIQIILAVQVYLLSVNASGFENGPVTDLCLLTVILQVGVCIALLVPLIHCVRECIQLYYQEDPTMPPMEEPKREIVALFPDKTEDAQQKVDKKESTQVGDVPQISCLGNTKSCEETSPHIRQRPHPIKISKVKERAAPESKDRNSTPISALCAEIRKGFASSKTCDSGPESHSTPVSTLCNSILRELAHLGSHIEATSSSVAVEPSESKRDHVVPLNLRLIHSKQLPQKEMESSLKPEPLPVPQRRSHPRRRPPPLQLDFDLLPRPLRIQKKK